MARSKKLTRWRRVGKAVLDNAMSQIRPLLTADQQKKADSMQQAHQDMEKAAKEMHDAAQAKP